MDSQRDAEKQVVSPSLLPQKWEMEYVENFFDERFAFMDSEWLPRGGISLEREEEVCGEFSGQQREKQDLTHVDPMLYSRPSECPGEKKCT